MNKYEAFYNGKRTTIEAESSYKAQLKGAEFFKVKPNRSYMVTVVLVEKANGEQVVHKADF